MRPGSRYSNSVTGVIVQVLSPPFTWRGEDHVAIGYINCGQPPTVISVKLLKRVYGTERASA